MKRLLSLALCLALISSAAVTAFAARPVIVSLGHGSTEAGGEWETVLSLSAEGVSAAGLTVIYDEDALKLRDIELMASGSFVKDVEKNRFSWLGGSDRAGEFALVKLIFDVAEDARGQYSITAELTGGFAGNMSDSAATELPVSFSAGILTVREPSEGGNVSPDGGCDGGTDCPSAKFEDLNTGAWYHEATDYVLSEGLMLGVGEESFAPSAIAGRAMLVTVLHRLEGCPKAGKTVDFKDVKDGAWYADAVAWAAEAGIAEGYGEGFFGPGDALTREQIAVIFHRYAKWKGLDVSARESLSHYSDADGIHPWAREAMEWAKAEGLMTGRSGSSIAPRATAMRSELATMLMRWDGISRELTKGTER